MKRLCLGVLCVAAGLSALGMPRPAAAAPPPLDVTCPFTLTANLDPGGTFTTQSQQLTGEIKLGSALSPAPPCSSLTGTPYRGATGRITGSGSVSCLLDGSMSGTIELTADNGDTSTLAWSFRSVLLIPLFALTPTSGVLVGATVVAVPLPIGFSGSCLLGPIRSVTFAGFVSVIRF